jgi:arylsulfatase A-like enzyme
MPNAIVIVIDRLGAGYLGPYGNTWCETPAFNRLASEGILWENAFVDNPTLKGFYRALTSGAHALESSPVPQHLIQQLAAAGVHSVFVSDDPELDKLPFSHEFSERVSVPHVGRRSAAESLDDTQTAHIFAAAMESIVESQSPYLLWMHLRGMSDQWDAPREYRVRFADEEDPSPPDFVDPPDKLLPQEADPDEILGVNQAFAGQVALIDDCLATWLEALSALPNSKDTLLVITSPRGYPLGERGGFGASTDGLHEEVLHVPLLIRVPHRELAMQRCQALVYPSDLNPTLRNWFGVTNHPPATTERDLLRLIDPRESQREFVVSTFHDARSLRTKAWFVTHVGDKPTQCFVKPDDRWEVNEVSNRRSDIVDHGLQALRAFEQAASENKIDELPKLPAMLLEAPE